MNGSNESSNSTICKDRQHKISDLNPSIGYIGAIVAILMFGSNFLPVKKIRTGDGMYSIHYKLIIFRLPLNACCLCSTLVRKQF